MAYLLPQFKCPPDILSIHFTAHPHIHIHTHSHQLRTRQPVCFRTQCILTTATTITTSTVIDMEKLRLPSLESHSHSVADERSLTYIGSIDPMSKASFRASLATETLTSEEAVIAAAAAEAVALAKAAVEVAKGAALMGGYNTSANLDCKPAKLSAEADNVRLERSLITNMERPSGLDVLEVETIPEEEHSTDISIKDDDILEPTDDELKLLQLQLSESIAVRSGRQTERRAKREKAAEKSASSVVSVNSGSSRRKKRAAAREIDYTDPLRYFRATTSGSRLLTATEEVELSAGVQALLKLETLHDELAECCGGNPTFAQWAAAAGIDQKTLRKRVNYGIYCKDRMIKSNLRLVISIAKNYQGAGLNIQDLVQEGCRGLVRGAEKFDASKGFKFSTYAHWWIKQTVRKSLSEQSRTIRLPFHMVEATYRVKEARKQLFNENGRYPDDKEIAEATGLTMKRLNAVLLAPKTPRSLDQKFGVDQNMKASDVTAHPDQETSEQVLIKQFMKQDLNKVLSSLTVKEKQVIQWRYGLEDGRLRTLQEIGELMGVSRERIRQIEKYAFRKLKNKKRTKNLKQYVVS